MGMIVSIIIPVYNVLKYLEKCIRSVLDQDYPYLDIVIVDDGSTDGSGELCDKIMQWDERIRIFHKKNGGLSEARNFGLQKSYGDFISFIDSDDYIDSSMISSLVEKISLENADISACGYDMIYPNKVDVIADGTEVQVLDSEQAYGLMFKRNNLGFIACNKLYRKCLFEDICFPPGKHFEDLYTTYRLIYKAKKVVYFPKPLYHYVQRMDSINGHNFNNRQFNLSLYDMKEAADEMMCFTKKEMQPCYSYALIGCFDFYLRVINQEIIFGVNNSTSVNNTRAIGRENYWIFRKADYILLKKRLQYLLFIYFFGIYRVIVKALLRRNCSK